MSENSHSTPKSNDLHDFMIGMTQDMAREYERIQKRATEDPGTAGDQGEENWATLLRGWLPPTYQVVTKGRILGHRGIASPQVDVLVLHPSYPAQLLDKKLYLAGGISAAFECKVTLKAEHIKAAIENSAVIKRLLQVRSGSPYKELFTPLKYGVLAHSHVWTGLKSTPDMNVHTHLINADLEISKHPREQLDLICVADLATWLIGKMKYFYPIPRDPVRYPVPHEIEVELEKTSAFFNGGIFSAYTRYSNDGEDGSQVPGFTPIGAMLCYLLNALAWEDASIRSLADYFRATLMGSGQGHMRRWEIDVYSEEVRARILSRNFGSERFWNEWGGDFPLS